MTLYTHYGCAMNDAAMDNFTRDGLKKVRQMTRWVNTHNPLPPGVNPLGRKRTPLFVYSGMSGTTCASALATVCRQRRVEYGLMYVRKNGEKSHGREREIWMTRDPWVYFPVFLDDFISTGDTMGRCLKGYFNWMIEGNFNPYRHDMNLEERIALVQKNQIFGILGYGGWVYITIRKPGVFQEPRHFDYNIRRETVHQFMRTI